MGYSTEINTKSARLKILQDCEDISNTVEIKSIQKELNMLKEHAKGLAMEIESEKNMI